MRTFPANSQIIVVGDSYAADVSGATAVGLPALLVRRQDVRAAAFHETLHALTDALSVA
jgi:FMN phosphatase YigB (HAD superfamily)